jgi:AcrR family transcriptional regulator
MAKDSKDRGSVPKKVDHDARRREIADALLALAAAEGLESVSLRHVAAAAGISMGAVQHYFRTKDEMLQFALQHQAERREQRIIARLTAVGREPTAREICRTTLVEVLPVDDVRRGEYLAGVAFFIRGLRDPLMAATLAEGGPKVHAFFADLLGRAQRDGDLVDGVDVHEEAVMLWSLVDAQAIAIVLGERTPDQAVATVDYQLDRLFLPAKVPG